MRLTCTRCGGGFEAHALGRSIPCPSCSTNLGPLAQLEQALAQWYEPRRWRADLVKPTAYYLIERLWTANGQGEALYRGVAPRHAGYDIFCHLLTRLIARGIEEGWAELAFPADPLAEDPVYHLRFRDPERFAREVEALFPEVDWDERIPLPTQD